ncbi:MULTISPECIES: hypothetical protein [Burkholderia]|uniref:hypothetical protein n=1 Tax=Burkholderia TaxID=32008 RepID=UPI000B02D23D|nr:MULTISPECIES: hypothetical protein [Burkholderia]
MAKLRIGDDDADFPQRPFPDRTRHAICHVGGEDEDDHGSNARRTRYLRCAHQAETRR